jgi:HlyD family secretion protein
VSALELARLQRLRKQRVASEQDFERAELARDEAGARLRASEAGLEAARKRMHDLELAAPGAAVVDQLPYEVGERVPAGAVLVVLLAEGTPWVRVWVPENAVVHVRPGGPAEITIDGIGSAEAPRRLAGKVLDVSREPGFTPHYALTERERVHLVYETRVEISDAPDGLRPGVPATVRLELNPVLVAGDADDAIRRVR